MSASAFVFALLRPNESELLPGLRETYRELTLAWARFGYRGRIIESDCLDAILAQAAETTARYCVVLRHGRVIREFWQADRADGGDFLSDLLAWAETKSFLLAAPLQSDAGRLIVDDGLLIVDLRQFAALGHPRAGDAGFNQGRQQTGRSAVGVFVTQGDTRIEAGVAGGLVAVGLAAQYPVAALPESLSGYLADLAPADSRQQEAFARFAKGGISRFSGMNGQSGLSRDQHQFLEAVQRQTANARRGVFLWNIEPYTDVEVPPPDCGGPLDTLYSVAAGFKPNRILATHGSHEATRVVYFDYSRNALEVRRELVDTWDGHDFVEMALHLFQRFPHPETFYQLWQGASPDTVSRDDLASRWEGEVARWGGAESFRAHWQHQRALDHHYVHCDLLEEPEPLFATLHDEENAVIWFSNAFFTFQSNWFMTFAERRTCYEAFLDALANRAPRLFLYGADYSNRNVNCVNAAGCWSAYRAGADSELAASTAALHDVRM